MWIDCNHAYNLSSISSSSKTIKHRHEYNLINHLCKQFSPASTFPITHTCAHILAHTHIGIRHTRTLTYTQSHTPIHTITHTHGDRHMNDWFPDFRWLRSRSWTQNLAVNGDLGIRHDVTRPWLIHEVNSPRPAWTSGPGRKHLSIWWLTDVHDMYIYIYVHTWERDRGRPNHELVFSISNRDTS